MGAHSIVEWATPTSCTEVRRFTGLADHYRRPLEGCAEIAAPAATAALDSPSVRLPWSPAAQASSGALKLALSSAPVLRIFRVDPNRRAVLSSITVAGILAQLDDEAGGTLWRTRAAN